MGTVNINEYGINVELSVFLFREGNVYHAYSPELDIVGYDNTEEGAKQSFEIALKEYIDYTLINKTLEADLLAHGWKKTEKGKVSVPQMIYLLKKPQVQRVLQKKEFSKYSVPVTL